MNISWNQHFSRSICKFTFPNNHAAPNDMWTKFLASTHMKTTARKSNRWVNLYHSWGSMQADIVRWLDDRQPGRSVDAQVPWWLVPIDWRRPCKTSHNRNTHSCTHYSEITSFKEKIDHSKFPRHVSTLQILHSVSSPLCGHWFTYRSACRQENRCVKFSAKIDANVIIWGPYMVSSFTADFTCLVNFAMVSVRRTHSYTHCLNGHFPCKPGLAGRSLDSQSSVIVILSTCTRQAEIPWTHIVVLAVPWAPHIPRGFETLQ